MGVIKLYKENPQTYEREALGVITRNQLDFLIENFEEEFEEDEEYLLNAATLDFLKDQKADKNLIALLEKALAGAQDGIDILYLEE
ncbi:MAG: galactosyldiacylglycerol synthase [Acidobacteria bacterium]|nr:galactosyldiacylglycerol synthase [Acidobacteriota bacterium]